ncbi:hypothetical protein [Parasitella parasitica]|uniref:Uncharacterized protein n=1 Tax=Parasitella parasitica TaxID=35722 RepID=A0A0B7NUC9_9FUNG|nr:hypothetical protein [Parasitella parasitica]
MPLPRKILCTAMAIETEKPASLSVITGNLDALARAVRARGFGPRDRCCARPWGCVDDRAVPGLPATDCVIKRVFGAVAAHCLCFGTTKLLSERAASIAYAAQKGHEFKAGEEVQRARDARDVAAAVNTSIPCNSLAALLANRTLYIVSI